MKILTKVVKDGLTKLSKIPSAIELTNANLYPISNFGRIRYGNYWTQIQAFIDVFGLEQIIFVDGTSMSNNEARHLEEQLNVNHELEFKFDRKKNFDCLWKPLKYCLSAAKGRRTGLNLTMHLADEIVRLKKYYQLEMELFYLVLYPTKDKSTFCADQNARFAWLKQYIC